MMKTDEIKQNKNKRRKQNGQEQINARLCDALYTSFSQRHKGDDTGDMSADAIKRYGGKREHERGQIKDGDQQFESAVCSLRR